MIRKLFDTGAVRLSYGLRSTHVVGNSYIIPKTEILRDGVENKADVLSRNIMVEAMFMDFEERHLNNIRTEAEEEAKVVRERFDYYYGDLSTDHNHNHNYHHREDAVWPRKARKPPKPKAK